MTHNFAGTLTSRIGGIFGSFTFGFKSILLITVSQRILGSSSLHHYSPSRGLHRQIHPEKRKVANLLTQSGTEKE